MKGALTGQVLSDDSLSQCRDGFQRLADQQTEPLFGDGQALFGVLHRGFRFEMHLFHVECRLFARRREASGRRIACGMEFQLLSFADATVCGNGFDVRAKFFVQSHARIGTENLLAKITKRLVGKILLELRNLLWSLESGQQFFQI